MVKEQLVLSDDSEKEIQGLKRILSETARELSGFSKLLDLDILPEVMRLILEKTAKNADLLWPDGFNDSDIS